MADPDPHQMMTCPYNKAHQVEHYRIHIHLQKCRQQYPNTKKVTCAFDSTHIVNDVEMDYHMLTCKKRSMFDTKVFVCDDDYRPVVEVQPPPAIVPTEENWDDDEVAPYIPDTSRKNDIIRKIKGATPAERRKARMEGVKTYRPPENGQGGDPGPGSSSSSST